MKRGWSILMTGSKEHCADTGMEHWDEKGTGALCGKESWIIVMRGFMELCDDKCHGAL